MNKKYIYSILILGLFTLLVLAEHFAPKPVNWDYHFSASKKIPYGCKVLKDMLPNVFYDTKITTNNQSLYPNLDVDHMEQTNLIFITRFFNVTSLDCEALLNHVENGNHVFISAIRFDGIFADTLNIKSGHLPKSIESITQSSVNSSVLHFVNPALKKDTGYYFSKHLPINYFSSFDTANTVILGTDSRKLVNFIKIKYGKGCFYLHSQPLVFTNYHLLYSNYEYSSAALSYLPLQTTVWDEYYKPFKANVRTPLRFILLNPPLKTAYLLTLLGIILYMIFEGRRKQRKIPILQPPRNDSVDFIKTVGKLFLHNHDHKDIALKKFNYFNEYVRSMYYLSTNNVDFSFYDALSQKSNVDIAIIQDIYDTAAKIKSADQISKEQLRILYKKIETFYTKST